MTSTPDPRSFIPLPPAPLHIVLALNRGERHGYAIMGDVESLSDGVIRMGPGTLYGAIKRLLDQGLIAESTQRPDPEDDDQRRRYYRLTGLGQEVCNLEIQRLANLVERSRPPVAGHLAGEGR